MADPIKFGRYTLIKRIAAGGMAEIFLAKQQGPGRFERSLVIKRILPHLAEDPKFTQMFLDEASLAAQLAHPHIAQVYDFGEEDGDYYIALELVKGPDLRNLLRAAKKVGSPPPVEISVRIITQVLAALDYAHHAVNEKGEPLNVVHRDISPQNILVSYDGVVKLVDFGIAKASSASTQTEAGVVKGKFAYLSPEQLMGMKLDGRCDMYAACLVLYEMLSLQTAILGDGANAIANAMEAKIIPITKHRDDLPMNLLSVLGRSLQKDRDNRAADCRALQGELDALLVEWGVSVPPHEVAKYLNGLEIEFGEPLSPAATTGSIRMPTRNASSGGTPPEPAPAPKAVGRTVVPGKPGSRAAPEPKPAPVALDDLSEPPPPKPEPEPEPVPEPEPEAVEAQDPEPPHRPDTDPARDEGNNATMLRGVRAVDENGEVPDEPRPDSTVIKATPAYQPPTPAYQPPDNKRSKSGVNSDFRWQPPEPGSAPRSRKSAVVPRPDLDADAPRRRSGGQAAISRGDANGDSTLPPVAGETPYEETPPPRPISGDVSAPSRKRRTPPVLEDVPTRRRGQAPPVEEKPKGMGPLAKFLAFVMVLGVLGGGGWLAYQNALKKGVEPPIPVEPKPIVKPVEAQPEVKVEKEKEKPKPREKVPEKAPEPKPEVAVAPPAPTTPTPEPEPKAEKPSRLWVTSTPWTDVTLDEKSLGLVPVKSFRIEPGSHTLVLKNPDMDISKTVTFQATAGEQVHKDFKFEKGKVDFRIVPWANVELNGKSLGASPFQTAIERYEGTYTAVFTNPQVKGQITRTVTVKPGETTAIKVNMTTEK